MRRLPTIKVRGKEWTVDERLQEFRFLVLGKMPEFVPFDSEEGRELMCTFMERDGRDAS